MKKQLILLFGIGFFLSICFGCVPAEKSRCPTERVWSICPYSGMLEYINPGTIYPGTDSTTFLTDREMQKKLGITEDQMYEMMGITRPEKDSI